MVTSFFVESNQPSTAGQDPLRVPPLAKSFSDLVCGTERPETSCGSPFTMSSGCSDVEQRDFLLLSEDNNPTPEHRRSKAEGFLTDDEEASDDAVKATRISITDILTEECTKQSSKHVVAALPSVPHLHQNTTVASGIPASCLPTHQNTCNAAKLTTMAATLPRELMATTNPNVLQMRTTNHLTVKTEPPVSAIMSTMGSRSAFTMGTKSFTAKGGTLPLPNTPVKLEHPAPRKRQNKRPISSVGSPTMTSAPQKKLRQGEKLLSAIQNLPAQRCTIPSSVNLVCDIGVERPNEQAQYAKTEPPVSPATIPSPNYGVAGFVDGSGGSRSAFAMGTQPNHNPMITQPNHNPTTAKGGTPAGTLPTTPVLEHPAPQRQNKRPIISVGSPTISTTHPKKRRRGRPSTGKETGEKMLAAIRNLPAQRCTTSTVAAALKIHKSTAWDRLVRLKKLGQLQIAGWQRTEGGGHLAAIYEIVQPGCMPADVPKPRTGNRKPKTPRRSKSSRRKKISVKKESNQLSALQPSAIPTLNPQLGDAPSRPMPTVPKQEPIGRIAPTPLPALLTPVPRSNKIEPNACLGMGPLGLVGHPLPLPPNQQPGPNYHVVAPWQHNWVSDTFSLAGPTYARGLPWGKQWNSSGPMRNTLSARMNAQMGGFVPPAYLAQPGFLTPGKAQLGFLTPEQLFNLPNPLTSSLPGTGRQTGPPTPCLPRSCF